MPLAEEINVPRLDPAPPCEFTSDDVEYQLLDEYDNVSQLDWIYYDSSSSSLIIELDQKSLINTETRLNL